MLLWYLVLRDLLFGLWTKSELKMSSAWSPNFDGRGDFAETQMNALEITKNTYYIMVYP